MDRFALVMFFVWLLIILTAFWVQAFLGVIAL